LKRNEEAEAAYRKAIELNPANDITYLSLGYLLRNLKRYEESEAAYRKAIELNPANAGAYEFLVRLLRLINRSEDAIPLLRKMIEINPEAFNPYIAIASINKLLGKVVSNDYAEKARELMPKDDWYNRACLESVCDHFELAFSYLERAAEQDRFDAGWAWEDPDLQWIRDDPRFNKIVRPKPE